MKALFGALLLAGLVASDAVGVEPPSGPVNLRGLPASAFNALPDGAAVAFGGRVVSKKQFLLEMEGRRKTAEEHKASNPNFRGARDPWFGTHEPRLVMAQRMRVEENNRMIRTRMAAPRPGGPPALPPGSCTKPTVSGVTVTSPVLPGADLIVSGCGFGGKGELRLVGDFPPRGYVRLQVFMPWTADAIIARVPFVSGAKDQSKSTLQVVTPDGLVSDPVALAFEATRDVVQLAPGDLSIECAASNPSDPCPGLAETCLGWATWSATHTSDDSAALLGTDVVKVSLKNGWAFAGYHWEWDGASGYVDNLDGFEPGQVDLVGSVPFGLLNKGFVGYRFWLYVAGPVGVSYR